MVKNEADVIRASLEHMLSQGIDGIIVADNGSQDATMELLIDVASRNPIYIVRDTEPAYYQAVKMNYLAKLARSCGADWIVPFDADEFWFAEGGSIASRIRSSAPAQVIWATMNNAFPWAPLSEKSLRSASYRFDLTAHKQRKLAYRWHWLATLQMGNHYVFRGGRQAEGLHIVHVPWRTHDQFARKLKQGARALAASDLDAYIGAHWRAAGRLSDAQLRDAWERVLRGEHDPHIHWTPRGPFEVARVLQWTSWRHSSGPGPRASPRGARDAQ